MDTGPMHLLPNSCLKDSHYNGIASPVLVVIEFQGNHLGSAWPATRFGIAAGYSRANGFELEICYVYCSIRLLGLGMILFESSCLAVKLSNLPNFTSQSGPPVSATASLEAMIMILAQETTPGQAFSRASLTLSTTSNDLKEFILERVNFSPSIVGVSSSNIEASHPLVHLPGELFLQFASALRIEINRGFSALSSELSSSNCPWFFLSVVGSGRMVHGDYLLTLPDCSKSTFGLLSWCDMINMTWWFALVCCDCCKVCEGLDYIHTHLLQDSGCTSASVMVCCGNASLLWLTEAPLWCWFWFAIAGTVLWVHRDEPFLNRFWCRIGSC
ncbi:hypothetical protein KIW84_013708 [Lathyrus oleraceus]|uniref:Uncharacterized protein n=1 Tax=Pisum sativum TaxID=3888 RepID=A0A9D5GY71_PEA|nr:hypothetical protein KIW84_013708 [Pisum sativum]